MLPTTSPPAERPTPKRLRIDFLFLDLATCARCRGAERNLESALDRLAATGAEIAVNKIHVTSVAQARELRLRTSPTIRVDGRDIAPELRESACTDGCGEHVACRVWVHEGREHTEPPVPMLLDAILRAVYAGAEQAHADPEPYELPENLTRFFAGTAAAADCCTPAAQRSCCAPEDKSACCGGGERCGCR